MTIFDFEDLAYPGPSVTSEPDVVLEEIAKVEEMLDSEGWKILRRDMLWKARQNYRAAALKEDPVESAKRSSFAAGTESWFNYLEELGQVKNQAQEILNEREDT